MTELSFQKCAIKGGADVWQKGYGDSKIIRPFAELVLMPEVWQAVGKVLEYEENGRKGRFSLCTENGNGIHDKKINWGEFTMHRMIDALCEGKSIEQFIETL